MMHAFGKKARDDVTSTKQRNNIKSCPAKIGAAWIAALHPLAFMYFRADTHHVTDVLMCWYSSSKNIIYSLTSSSWWRFETNSPLVSQLKSHSNITVLVL
jgi:hypothetical protein